MVDWFSTYVNSIVTSTLKYIMCDVQKSVKFYFLHGGFAHINIYTYEKIIMYGVLFKN
jgi:hypothetical protein